MGWHGLYYPFYIFDLFLIKGGGVSLVLCFILLITERCAQGSQEILSLEIEAEDNIHAYSCPKGSIRDRDNT